MGKISPPDRQDACPIAGCGFQFPTANCPENRRGTTKAQRRKGRKGVFGHGLFNLQPTTRNPQLSTPNARFPTFYMPRQPGGLMVVFSGRTASAAGSRKATATPAPDIFQPAFPHPRHELAAGHADFVGVGQPRHPAGGKGVDEVRPVAGQPPTAGFQTGAGGLDGLPPAQVRRKTTRSCRSSMMASTMARTSKPAAGHVRRMCSCDSTVLP